MFQNGGTKVSERRAFPLWQRAATFTVGYFVCAVVGSQLSVPGAVNVSFWLPSGLFMAVLLRNPTSDWPWLVLAVLPAGVAFELVHEAHPRPLLIAFFYLANVARAVAGAWLVRRWVAERPTLATLQEFFGLIFFGGIVSALLGSLIGAAALTLVGLSQDFLGAFFRWWASSFMSVLVFTPMLLTWVNVPKGRRIVPLRPVREVEITVFVFGLTFCTWWLLVWGGGVNSPKVPLLIFALWAGLRFGVRGAAATVLWLAVLMSYLTTHFLKGLSAAEIESKDYIVTLQIYLVVTACVALVPPILLAERDRTLARLRQSEARFRHLTEAAFEGIAISENGLILDVNDQCCHQFGYSRAEMIGMPLLDCVAPESKPAAAAAIGQKREAIIQYQLLRKDGSKFDAEVQAKIMSLDGRVLGMTAVRDISERKRAERTLHESEEKYSKAFRASPDGLAISELTTGRYLEINEGYCRLFGYSAAEMIGHTSIELGLWRDLQDRKRLVNGLQSLGAVRDLEVQMRTRSGELKSLLLSAESIEVAGTACLVSVLHDVTDRMRAETALRASEESLRATIENTPNVAVQWYDHEARIVFWNLASEKIFGWPAAAALGKTLDQLIFTAEQATGFAEKLRRIAQTGEPVGPMEFPFRHRCGTPGTVLSTVFCIPVLNGESRFVCMDVDLTERKNAESAREQAVAREQQARIEYTLRLIAAQEAERKRIAAELHDSLGQNLLLIKNRAQMALTPAGKIVEQQEQFRVINQLAAACIAEARQISHDLHPQQLEHLGLKRALEVMLENTAAASDIQFTWKIEDVENVFPHEAEMNFYRIVQESLNNILKHSRAQNVRVELERDLQAVRLRVSDDGAGFAAEQTTGSKSGLGLKNIAERTRMLGGKLKLDSAPGQGTHLEVTAPVTEPV